MPVGAGRDQAPDSAWLDTDSQTLRRMWRSFKSGVECRSVIALRRLFSVASSGSRRPLKKNASNLVG
jgi:hypothetical protein